MSAMRFTDQSAAQPDPIPHLNDRYLADEEALVRELAEAADPGDSVREKIRYAWRIGPDRGRCGPIF